SVRPSWLKWVRKGEDQQGITMTSSKPREKKRPIRTNIDQAKTSGQNCHLIYGTADLDCYGCPSVSGYCCYSGRHGDTIHRICVG
ncbi:MAG: hypothetical protein PF442_08425, partial [Desulfobulbaceae bacterium]|nr:hypothetical protein [Desulfobulbaceae bacterium]